MLVVETIRNLSKRKKGIKGATPAEIESFLGRYYILPGSARSHQEVEDVFDDRGGSGRTGRKGEKCQGPEDPNIGQIWA